MPNNTSQKNANTVGSVAGGEDPENNSFLGVVPIWGCDSPQRAYEKQRAAIAALFGP